MVKTLEDLAAFQDDTESKGRFMFGFGGSLKLTFLSGQLSVPHFVQLSHKYVDLDQTALS